MRIGQAAEGDALRCGDRTEAHITSFRVTVPSRTSVLKERASISEKLRADALTENRSALIVKLREWGVHPEQAESSVPKNVPPNVDIVASIREARSMTAKEFWNAVKSGGKWDFKRYGKSEYEDFGNWHFGVVVRAWTAKLRDRGLSELDDDFLLEMAQRGAGGYQWKTRTNEPAWGHPLGGYPFGDDPRDSERIRSGWQIERRLEEPDADSNRGGAISLP